MLFTETELKQESAQHRLVMAGSFWGEEPLKKKHFGFNRDPCMIAKTFNIREVLLSFRNFNPQALTKYNLPITG